MLDTYLKSLEKRLIRPAPETCPTEELYYTILQTASEIRYNEDQAFYKCFEMGSDGWAYLDNHPSRFTIQPSFKELVEVAGLAKECDDWRRLRAIEEELLDNSRAWAEGHPIKEERLVREGRR